MATVVDPGVVLADALAGHPNTALTFRFHSGAWNLAFRAGKVTGDARSVTLDLHDGWTLRAFSTAPATGMLTDQNARTLLLGGIALSVLLGLLVYMLGTGRARAIARWPSRRASAHQALHDGLTGLPDRCWC